jgi:hypothetical protein
VKLRFLVPSDEFGCVCSQCDQPSEMLARLELKEALVNGVPAFAGLCQRCVEQLLIGFFRAEAMAQAGEVDVDEEPVPPVAQ